MTSAVNHVSMFVRTVIACCAVLSAIGCQRDAPQFPEYSPTDGNPALLTPTDIAVYEAMISAYADAGQVLMLRKAPGPPPGTAATEPEIDASLSKPVVRVRPSTLKGTEVSPQPSRWRALNGETAHNVVVPQSAITDFRERNSRRASLRQFHTTHLEILWSEEMGTLSCLYSWSLPGYSRSKDEAVVEISCGTWALAGGGELLYLRRSGGKWHVLAKQQTWIS